MSVTDRMEAEWMAKVKSRENRHVQLLVYHFSDEGYVLMDVVDYISDTFEPEVAEVDWKDNGF